MTKKTLVVVIESYKTGAHNNRIKARELGLGFAALKRAHEAAVRKRPVQGRR